MAKNKTGKRVKIELVMSQFTAYNLATFLHTCASGLDPDIMHPNKGTGKRLRNQFKKFTTQILEQAK